MFKNPELEANKLIAKTLREWIWNQDNKVRIENYQVYEDYYDGEHEVHLPPKLKEALETDFKVISNYCKTVVDKAVGYLCGQPIGIEVVPDTFGLSKEELKEIRKREEQAERLLYNVYRNNHFLKKNIVKLIRVQGKKGDVFVKCYVDVDEKNDKSKETKYPEDRIKLKVLRPDIVYPKFKDDDYEEYDYIAIVFDRFDENGQVYKYAQVFWDDVVREYKSEGSGKEWEQIGPDKPNEIGMIPIVHIKNNEDDTPWGRSDIEDIITLQDAINKSLTDLMYNGDFQAFQRVIITGHEATPLTPEEVRDNQQYTGPGSVMSIPDLNAKVYNIEAGDSSQLISIIKTIRQEISANGRIPQIALSQADGAGAASSLALRIHYQPLDEKCNEKATLAADGLQQINRIILAYYKKLTKEDYTDMYTEARFSKSMPVDRREEAMIHETEDKNQWKSKDTIRNERGVADPDEEKEKIRQEMEEFGQGQDVYENRIDKELKDLLGGGTGTEQGDKGSKDDGGKDDNSN